MRSAALLLALIALPSDTAFAADSLQSDSRIASLAWREGAELPLAISPGNSVTVVFAPGEAIKMVTVGDPSSVQVVPSSNGDSMVIHTLHSLPPTGIGVETDRHAYRFTLMPSTDGRIPYVVRLTYAAPTGLFGPPQQAPAASGTWKLSGTRALQPVAISDDGVHTYIRWSPDQLIPAVFAVNDVGGEEMVDGYMRGDVFTIDRVNRALVFRIDRAKARAERLALTKEKRR